MSGRCILFVEDDVAFADELIEYLNRHGIADVVHSLHVPSVADIEAAAPTLIVLDQFVDGFDTLTMFPELTRAIACPIVLLSGNQEAVDRIIGLEAGAVDYIVKTTSPREILARLRAALRRGEAAAPERAAPLRAASSSSGGWTFDAKQRQLLDASGEKVRLTGLEFELFKTLYDSFGKPVSRETLTALLLNRRYQPQDRAIDNLVSRIRSRLDEHGIDRDIMQNIRGLGYVLIQPDSAAE